MHQIQYEANTAVFSTLTSEMNKIINTKKKTETLFGQLLNHIYIWETAQDADVGYQLNKSANQYIINKQHLALANASCKKLQCCFLETYKLQ